MLGCLLFVCFLFCFSCVVFLLVCAPVLHYRINAHMSGKASQIPRPVPRARGHTTDLPLEMDAETTTQKCQRHSSASSNESSSTETNYHGGKPPRKKCVYTPDNSGTCCSSASATADPNTTKRMTPTSAGTSSSTRPPTNASADCSRCYAATASPCCSTRPR